MFFVVGDDGVFGVVVVGVGLVQLSTKLCVFRSNKCRNEACSSRGSLFQTQSFCCDWQPLNFESDSFSKSLRATVKVFFLDRVQSAASRGADHRNFLVVHEEDIFKVSRRATSWCCRSSRFFPRTGSTSVPWSRTSELCLPGSCGAVQRRERCC